VYAVGGGQPWQSRGTFATREGALAATAGRFRDEGLRMVEQFNDLVMRRDPGKEWQPA
jgi:hypothetical protein